jgi:signal transduction histidine kinase
MASTTKDTPRSAPQGSAQSSEQSPDQRLEQLSRLARHLIRDTDAEKARLARELHDEVGSNLTAANLDVAAVEDKLKTTEPALAVRLRRALDSMRTVVGLSRRIIEDLRPSALDNMDLVEALRGHCEDFTQRTGLECVAELDEELGELDRDRSLALFSIAQESLDNAALHGKPSAVVLQLKREPGGTRLRVTDNGNGLPDDALAKSTAHGLLKARERISMVGGTFDIRRGDAGRGTIVDVFVPSQ